MCRPGRQRGLLRRGARPAGRQPADGLQGRHRVRHGGHADFWIGELSEGDGFRESHIAFAAASRAQVDAFFAAAVANGAEVLHEPRIHEEYHENYYGAFVRDPDGNNVEAVSHRPE
jgi:predicted lactoylglutathione lyase